MWHVDVFSQPKEVSLNLKLMDIELEQILLRPPTNDKEHREASTTN